jgi:hypothetical protein
MLDLDGEFGANRFVKYLLRIIQPPQFVVARQNYRGRHYRAGERGHACFVDAGDEVEALLPQLNLETQQVMQALALGAIPAPAFANLFGELVRALTRVGFECLNQTPGHGPRAIDVTALKLRN